MGGVAEPRGRRKNGRKRKDLVFETLEPRLLLSADFMPIDGRIDLPGETDSYVFTLDTARRIHIDALTDGQTNWRLTDAFGNLIDTDTSANTNGTTSPSIYSLVQGTYTFSVAGIGAATGNYRFDLLDLDAAPAIVSGGTIEHTLVDGRETMLLGYIDVLDGERLAYDAVGQSAGNSYNARIRIVDAANREVMSGSNVDGATDALQSGRYWALLESDIASPGLVYSVRLERQSAMPVDVLDGAETDIAFGTPQSGTLVSLGDVHRYRFTVADGDWIVFDKLTSVGAYARITDPFGQVQLVRMWGGEAGLPSSQRALGII